MSKNQTDFSEYSGNAWVGTLENSYIIKHTRPKQLNPVKDRLYLTSNQPVVNGVRIYQSDSRLLTIYDGNAFLNGVDVSTLSGGIYIISLSTLNGTHYQKFIKLGD